MSELPPVLIQHPHVEIRDEVLSGSPVVRGTRVPVRRLWAWFRKGVLAETLIKRYPALGAAKVLDALSFAFDNQDLMHADIERETRAMERDLAEASFPTAQQKLKL